MRTLRLLLASTGITGLVVVGAVLRAEPPATRASAPAPPAAVTATAPDRAATAAARLLRSWDQARAAAWAAGDAEALRRLYRPGADAGRADVAMLRAWADRGLRVRGLATQLLAVQVVERAPGRWLLRVRDRVAAAVAVGNGVRHELPAHRAAESIVELVAADGVWQVRSVRPARSR